MYKVEKDSHKAQSDLIKSIRKSQEKLAAKPASAKKPAAKKAPVAPKEEVVVQEPAAKKSKKAAAKKDK